MFAYNNNNTQLRGIRYISTRVVIITEFDEIYFAAKAGDKVHNIDNQILNFNMEKARDMSAFPQYKFCTGFTEG